MCLRPEKLLSTEKLVDDMVKVRIKILYTLGKTSFNLSFSIILTMS